MLYRGLHCIVHTAYLLVHLKLVLGEWLQLCPGGGSGKVVLWPDQKEEVIEEETDHVLGSSDLEEER